MIQVAPPPFDIASGLGHVSDRSATVLARGSEFGQGVDSFVVSASPGRSVMQGNDLVDVLHRELEAVG